MLIILPIWINPARAYALCRFHKCLTPLEFIGIPVCSMTISPLSLSQAAIELPHDFADFTSDDMDNKWIMPLRRKGETFHASSLSMNGVRWPNCLSQVWVSSCLIGGNCALSRWEHTATSDQWLSTVWVHHRCDSTIHVHHYGHKESENDEKFKQPLSGIILSVSSLIFTWLRRFNAGTMNSLQA